MTLTIETREDLATPPRPRNAAPEMSMAEKVRAVEAMADDLNELVDGIDTWAHEDLDGAWSVKWEHAAKGLEGSIEADRFEEELGCVKGAGPHGLAYLIENC